MTADLKGYLTAIFKGLTLSSCIALLSVLPPFTWSLRPQHHLSPSLATHTRITTYKDLFNILKRVKIP